MNEGHGEQFLIQIDDGEACRMQGLDVLHGLVSSTHQIAERLVLSLPNAEESLIGIEACTRLLLEMHRVEFLPLDLPSPA